VYAYGSMGSVVESPQRALVVSLFKHMGVIGDPLCLGLN
jgi:hypothetical protein